MFWPVYRQILVALREILCALKGVLFTQLALFRDKMREIELDLHIYEGGGGNTYLPIYTLRFSLKDDEC